MDQARDPRVTPRATPEWADAQAVREILSVEPRLDRLEPASQALGLGRYELVHAGPAVRDRMSPCRPILHSAITAALFEGWAETPAQAERMIGDGAIRLGPAQDANCVVPLADVVSPSMWVQGVADGLRVCWSPINGGSEHPLRVGVRDDEVLARLRWINGPLAEALARSLSEPVPVLDLADRGLAGGDDCHARTSAATAALADVLGHRVEGALGECLRTFLRQSPSFFLNIWMAASKLMLGAARGVGGSTVVIAAGGNGTEFGIQIAAIPDRWFVAEAAPPVVAPGSLGNAEALGAIGDSAVVDILGLGAMATLQRGGTGSTSALVGAVTGVERLLHEPHPRMARTHPPMVLSSRRVIDSERLPVISLGVLDRAGKLGRLTGGFYRPPASIFRAAISACAA